MKRNVFNFSGIFSLCLIALMTFYSSPARAHSPSDVQCSYDMQKKQLQVTITHGSPMPSMHYIKTVDITKNGVLISNNVYTSQPDSSPFTYSFTIEAADGDAFSVTTVCNMFGSRSAVLLVKKPAK